MERFADLRAAPLGGSRVIPPPPQCCIRREETSEAVLEPVGQAVGGGCRSGWGRLQMPLRPALGVRGTVAGHRLGTVETGGW